MAFIRRSSCFLFFALFYLAWVLRATIFYSAVDSSIPNEAARLILANAVKIVLWIFPAVAYIIWVDQKNPWEVMRISTKVNWAGMRAASFVAVLYFVGVFAVEYFFHGHTLLALFQSTPLQIMHSLLAVLVSPFAEEFLFRGFVLSKLQASRSFWPANTWQSAFFVAMHLPLWLWLNGLSLGLFIPSLSLFILSLLLGWITFRTNSIWLPVGLHVLNNFLVSFLG